MKEKRREQPRWMRAGYVLMALIILLGTSVPFGEFTVRAATSYSVHTTHQDYHNFVNTYDDGQVDKFQQSVFEADGWDGSVYCIEPKVWFQQGEREVVTFQSYMKESRNLTFSDQDITRLALAVDYIENQLSDDGNMDRKMLVQAYLWSHLEAPDGSHITSIELDGETGLVERVNQEADAWADKYVSMAKGTAYAFPGDNSSQAVGSFSVTYTGSLKLQKSSSDRAVTDGNEQYSLKGAVYSVEDEQGAYVGELVTDEKGESNTLTNLPPGYYIVTEVAAPAGYLLNQEKMTVEVSERSVATVHGEDTPKYLMPNLLLSKYSADLENAEKVPGAEYTFRYFDSEAALDTEEVTRTWVFRTDENGEIRGEESYIAQGDDLYQDEEGNIIFPLGYYRIQETKAPEGYLLDENIYERELLNDQEELKWEAIESTELFHLTVISKQDMVSGDELPGATLQVFDQEGNLITSWVSESEPHTIQKLPNGIYTLREITAPDGYEIAEDVEFEIKEDEVLCNVVMKDKPIPEEKPEEPEAPKKSKDVPDTGDGGILLPGIILLMSLFAVHFIRKFSKQD